MNVIADDIWVLKESSEPPLPKMELRVDVSVEIADPIWACRVSNWLAMESVAVDTEALISAILLANGLMLNVLKLDKTVRCALPIMLEGSPISVAILLAIVVSSVLRSGVPGVDISLLIEEIIEEERVAPIPDVKAVILPSTALLSPVFGVDISLATDALIEGVAWLIRASISGPITSDK